MLIRPAVVGDLPALTAIYNHYVVHSHSTFDVHPSTVAERGEWFRQFDTVGPHRLLVATDGEAVGYACSTWLRPKPAYLTSVETSVYVRPDHVGRGLGTQLCSMLLTLLAEEDVHRAYAVIALPGDASAALHEGLGYRHVGTFKEAGRKFGRYIDIAWYEKPFATHP